MQVDVDGVDMKSLQAASCKKRTIVISLHGLLQLTLIICVLLHDVMLSPWFVLCDSNINGGKAMRLTLKHIVGVARIDARSLTQPQVTYKWVAETSNGRRERTGSFSVWVTLQTTAVNKLRAHHLATRAQVADALSWARCTIWGFVDNHTWLTLLHDFAGSFCPAAHN